MPSSLVPRPSNILQRYTRKISCNVEKYWKAWVRGYMPSLIDIILQLVSGSLGSSVGVQTVCSYQSLLLFPHQECLTQVQPTSVYGIQDARYGHPCEKFSGLKRAQELGGPPLTCDTLCIATNLSAQCQNSAP